MSLHLQPCCLWKHPWMKLVDEPRTSAGFSWKKACQSWGNSVRRRSAIVSGSDCRLLMKNTPRQLNGVNTKGVRLVNIGYVVIPVLLESGLNPTCLLDTWILTFPDRRVLLKTLSIGAEQRSVVIRSLTMHMCTAICVLRMCHVLPDVAVA